METDRLSQRRAGAGESGSPRLLWGRLVPRTEGERMGSDFSHLNSKVQHASPATTPPRGAAGDLGLLSGRGAHAARRGAKQPLPVGPK